MIKEAQIRKLVETQIKGTDMFIVNVVVKPGNQIFVYLDSDNAVTIDDCVSISRFVENSLDRDVEDFELEVSSSGFRPLKLQRQYEKNIGRELKVTLEDGDKHTGRLIQVDDDGIMLKIQKKKKDMEEKFFPFAAIKKAVVEPSFKKK